LRKIVASQPCVYSAAYNEKVPLHVDPSAQRLHSSGDIVGGDGEPLVPDLKPSDEVSLVYVSHEMVWRMLSAMQRQGVLRHRAVLVIHRRPFKYDGREFKFDDRSLEKFTNLDRDAHIQGEHCVVLFRTATKPRLFQILVLAKTMSPLACRSGDLETSSRATTCWKSTQLAGWD